MERISILNQDVESTQQAEVVFAYTQVKMEISKDIVDNYRTMFECPDIWIRLPEQLKWSKS